MLPEVKIITAITLKTFGAIVTFLVLVTLMSRLEKPSPYPAAQPQSNSMAAVVR
jgi:hypothetical protein